MHTAKIKSTNPHNDFMGVSLNFAAHENINLQMQKIMEKEIKSGIVSLVNDDIIP